MIKDENDNELLADCHKTLDRRNSCKLLNIHTGDIFKESEI